jgi:hypothetical protein
MPDDQDPGVIDSLAAIMGRRLDRVSFGVLSDHVDREPVVPEDLHLVTAARPDADGNIACMECGRLVPYAAAEMVGSEGMRCGTCVRPAIDTALPDDTRLGRRLWPWLVGVPVAAAAVIYGIWHHERAMDRAEYEHQYPSANTPEDDAAITRDLARWQPHAVLDAIAAPPEISTLRLGAACTVTTDRTLEFRAHDDDAKTTLAYLFQDAKRGRYYDDDARTRTVRQLAGPIVVVSIADAAAPEMVGSGSNMSYYGGYRTGAAYVYAIDGTLQCAGTFDVESSDVVKYRTWKSNDPRLNGDEKYDASSAVAYDLDTKMHDGIVAGLKLVER